MVATRIACTGNEQQLVECPGHYGQYLVNNACSHEEDVGLRSVQCVHKRGAVVGLICCFCSVAVGHFHIYYVLVFRCRCQSTPQQIRTKDGRLEVLIDKKWGTICYAG